MKPRSFEQTEFVSYAPAIGALLTEEFPQDQVEVEAKVSGNIPAWLNGSLYRNGPGTYKNLRHLFDGYACLSKARCQNGRVFVSKKQIQTKAWEGYAKDAQPQFAEFATPVSTFKAVKTLLWSWLGLGQPFTDNAAVSILPIPDEPTRGLALTESVTGTYEMDLTSLATLKQVQYSDRLPGILTTAHPAVMADGTIVNLTHSPGSRYQLYRQKPGAEIRDCLASVPMRRRAPCWIHDFPNTDNYIVLPETPCYFDFKAVALGKDGDFAIMDWDDKEDVLLHVVPLSGGPVRTFKAPSYFTFHYLNSYEKDGKIHMDASHHKDPEMLRMNYLDVLRRGDRAICSAPVRRVTIDLADPDGSMATVTKLMDDDDAYRQCEFPTVHPAKKGKPYRYAYGAASRPPHTYLNALGKFDVETGEVKLWHEPGAIPTEPIMVPRQHVADNETLAEDDGAVLAMVTDANAKCFLLVLDASSFQELGRAWLPYNVAYQFHGRFVAAD